MASDIFAPPTQDELKMFAPPTKEELQSVQPQQPTMGQSALRGAAQGVTLGFADELAGAGISAMEAAQKRSLSDVVKDYIANRDRYREEDKKARAANPWTYGVGDFGGAMALPLGGVLKGTTAGVRAAKAAGLGAMAGLGASNAPVSSPMTALSVGTGAALGGAFQPLAEYAAKPVQSLSETAENLAVRHLRPTPKVARTLGPDRLRDIGREALDSGSIGFANKADTTAANLGQARQETGALIGDFREGSFERVNPVELSEHIKSTVVDPLRQTAEGQAIADKIQAKLDNFVNQYAPGYKLGELEKSAASMTPNQLEAEKSAVQEGINWGSDKPLAEANMAYADELRKAGEKAIPGEGFTSAKRSYGNLKTAQNMAEGTAGLTSGGTGLVGSLLDMGVGHIAATGLMHGNPAGLALGAARGLTKGRMASAGAVSADILSKKLAALAQNPLAARFLPMLQAAQKNGSASLGTTMFLLGQTEPDFQKAMENP